MTVTAVYDPTPGQNIAEFETDLMDLPTGAADVITQSFRALEIWLTNTTGAPVNVTVSNRALVPRAVIPLQPLLPSSVLTLISAHGRPFENGLAWVASAPGVHGYIRGRYTFV